MLAECRDDLYSLIAPIQQKLRDQMSPLYNFICLNAIIGHNPSLNNKLVMIQKGAAHDLLPDEKHRSGV